MASLTRKEKEKLSETVDKKLLDVIVQKIEDNLTAAGDVASEIIRRNLTEYAAKIIGEMFPNHTDCLKAVQRRIIWTLRTDSNFEKTSARATSVRKYHDHGESSIAGAIGRMAQPFMMSHPLIEFFGDMGQYARPRRGSDRYTESRLSEFARDLFLKGIEESAIVKQQAMDLTGYEPSYLVPVIPTTLFFNSLTVGYGHTSNIPSRNFADICKLAIAYIAHRENHPNHVPFPLEKYAKLLVPDFPIMGVITNFDEIVEAYKQNKFEHPIGLEGVVVLTQDEIRVKTLPFGERVNKIVEYIQEQQSKEKNGWINQHILGVSPSSNEDMYANIIISVKRNTNVFDAWDRIRKTISFSRMLHPKLNYTNEEGQIVSPDPVFLLENWYDRRRKAIMSSKRQIVARQSAQLRITKALLIIRDYDGEVIDIVRNRDELEAQRMLMDRFKITQFQADAIVRREIRSLTKTSKEELQKQHDDQERRLKETMASFNSVAEEMTATIQALMKKYAKPRMTVVPKYIGYVAVDGGTIQVEKTSEIEQILTDFSRGDFQVHLYSGQHIYQLLPNNRFSDGYIPKYSTGEIVGLNFPKEKTWTVNISDGAACVVKGLVPGSWKDGYFYTTRMARVITRSGKVKTVDVTEEFSLRKNICRGANTDAVYVYPDHKDTNYVLVFNDAEPNIMILTRVDGNTTSITTNPTGNVRMIHTTLSKDWYFTVPPEFLNRANVRLFHIVDMEAVLDEARQIRIDIGQQKWKRSANFKMM